MRRRDRGVMRVSTHSVGADHVQREGASAKTMHRAAEGRSTLPGLGLVGRSAAVVCESRWPASAGTVRRPSPVGKDELPILPMRGLRLAPSSRRRAVPVAKRAHLQAHHAGQYAPMAPVPKCL